MSLTTFREFQTADGRTGECVFYAGTVTVKVGGRYKTAPMKGGVHPRAIAERLLRELLEAAA